jgi:hypothetical protein
MRKSVVVFGLFITGAAFAGALAACSSSTTTTETGPGDGGGSETSTPADGGKDTSTATDSSKTADPDDLCAEETTQNACGQCCATNHPAGYKVFQDSLLGCVCDGDGADGGAPCATQCATTLCKTPPVSADQTCQTCLQGSINTGGACQESVSAACTANPDCIAQQKCVTPCTKKSM